jgi:hypothetical protein
MAVRANLFRRLGTALATLGDPGRALRTTHEAVKLHRILAGSWPATFEQDLARSLNSLGDHLQALGA